jgi:hypothetical protein
VSAQISLLYCFPLLWCLCDFPCAVDSLPDFHVEMKTTCRLKRTQHVDQVIHIGLVVWNITKTVWNKNSKGKCLERIYINSFLCMCVDLACVLVKYKYENKYMQIDYILLFQILWKKSSLILHSRMFAQKNSRRKIIPLWCSWERIKNKDELVHFRILKN